MHSAMHGAVRRAAGLAVVGVVAGGLFAGCAAPVPPPFDPRDFGSGEITGSALNTTPAYRVLPTELDNPYVDEDGRPRRGAMERIEREDVTVPLALAGAEVPISLREAVQRAVVNNLEVAVAGFQPAIEQARVVEAESRFDPVLFWNNAFQKTDRDAPFDLNQNPLTQNEASRFNQFTSAVGVRQLLESGGQVQLSLDYGWNELPTRSGPLTPDLDEDFQTLRPTLSINQPLLRDFGRTTNRARIIINRNQQQISLLDFRTQLETTIRDVEQAYWNLVRAIEDVRIQESLLLRTIETADILRARIDQDVSSVQIFQAEARISARRASLERARAVARNASDRLKQLINVPDLPVAGPALLVPSTLAVAEPIVFDLDDQIETAFVYRAELGQQQLRIDSADLTLKVAKNNLRPQLDLVASASLDSADNSPSGLIEDVGGADYFSWSIGLQLEIPLGNREARAIYRRVLLQRQQAVTQYASIQNQISLDVTTTLREVVTTWQELALRRKQRFEETEALAGLQAREDAGEPLTPQFVDLKLNTQERVAEAERSEVEALSAYNVAIANLERAKGTLLRYNNVVMAEEDLPFGSSYPRESQFDLKSREQADFLRSRPE
ncbi:MAG: TolC family protein [Phycisphaerae bacterium]